MVKGSAGVGREAEEKAVEKEVDLGAEEKEADLEAVEMVEVEAASTEDRTYCTDQSCLQRALALRTWRIGAVRDVYTGSCCSLCTFRG